MIWMKYILQLRNVYAMKDSMMNYFIDIKLSLEIGIISQFTDIMRI